MTWRCRLGWHLWELFVGGVSVRLRCVECGVLSPGWTWIVRPYWSGRVLRFKKRLRTI